jgi:hypothetical protein
MDATPMLARHVKRQRDTERVVAVHPIKELAFMRDLAGAIR